MIRALVEAIVFTKGFASKLGADYVVFPLWATFYLAGKADNNPRAHTGRIGIEALIDADITVNILKFDDAAPPSGSARRERVPEVSAFLPTPEA